MIIDNTIVQFGSALSILLLSKAGNTDFATNPLFGLSMTDDCALYAGLGAPDLCGTFYSNVFLTIRLFWENIIVIVGKSVFASGSLFFEAEFS